ncbi:MAG: tetratricopeptide repeat protein [Puniceicoccales bacterium]|jgi:tetratricopeptide (TPR) repeat protein|nr:tetratricopeptide repeat protein [Puniceicoccales bacterium]
MGNLSKYFLLFILILEAVPCFSESEQASGYMDESEFIAIENTRDFASLIRSGNNACRIGFFTVAKKFFTQALAIKNLSNEQKCAIFSGLIESDLAMGNFSGIADNFDAIQKLTNSEIQSDLRNKFLINAAIVACLRSDFFAANKILLKANVKNFSDLEFAWYYALKSVLCAISMNFEEMASNLKEAERLSLSSDQAAQIQAFSIQFMLQIPVKSAEFSNLLAALNALQQKYERQSSGHPFIKAYALLLTRIGGGQQAEELLDRYMEAIETSDEQNLQSFRLYKAVACGLHSPHGHDIILTLLLSPVEDEMKKQALKLLVSSAANSNQRIEALKMLSVALKNLQNPSGGMVRQILFAKMRLAVDAEKIDAAQQIAEEIILLFPQEPLMPNIYEALAYLACQQTPRDYRMAAHYLGKLRELASNEREKIALAIQIGNAFYLCDAYDIASQVYEEILKSNLEDIAYDRILYQLIQTAVKSNNLPDMEQHLLNFRQTHDSLTEYRWHAELLYVNALIRCGNSTQATNYLSLLLDAYAPNIPSFYLVKFYLLQAHSMLSKQNYQRAHILALRICEIFPSRSHSAEIAEIASKALFIKGTCELKLKNESDGIQTFKQLRKMYPEQEIAILSYFEEAEYQHQRGNTAIACKILLECAKSECKYSPFAYYKCAEYYKSLGMQNYDDAIACLSALSSKYENHEIVYAARLEIADILRMSGKFSDAELAYEELLKNFPLDKRYYFTEFCLAKSIFSQKSKGDVFGDRAQMILERLYSTVTSGSALHVEIAAMYCFVLGENSRPEEMKKIAWETLLTSVAEEGELTRKDIYWLLQIANILRDFYLSENDSLQNNKSDIEALTAMNNKLKGLFTDPH